MNENQLLHEFYYNPSNGESLTTAEKLQTSLKNNGHRIPLKNVKLWLADQLTYNLHKPARRRFPRNKIYVKSIGELVQADLVDMSEFSSMNKGNKFLLTAIDVFSKRAFVEPLKNKSASEVEKAFSKIIESFKFQSLQTDRGKEFKNTVIDKLMKDNHVNHYFSLNKDIKCGVVERFNRTLKSRMFKYFTHVGSRKYIDKLPHFVEGYNKSYHSVIKMAPSQVTESNSKIVFRNIYGHDSPREYVKTIIATKSKSQKLKSGDKVRQRYEITGMEKGFYPNWTDAIFTVQKVIKVKEIPMFILANENGNLLERNFYGYELQKVESENPVYRIEKIISRRKGKALVKWLNHPESENSWVNISDIQNV